jgi:hypothetical protein
MTPVELFSSAPALDVGSAACLLMNSAQLRIPALNNARMEAGLGSPSNWSRVGQYRSYRAREPTPLS